MFILLLVNLAGLGGDYLFLFGEPPFEGYSCPGSPQKLEL